MQSPARVADRKKAIAFIAGLIQPGLGQIYNGQLIKGICLFVFFIAALIGGMRIVMMFPGRLLLLCTGLMVLFALAIFIVFAIEAWLFATSKGKGYALKWFNRWYSYIVIYVVCSVFITSAAFSYVSDNIAQFYRVATVSMSPAVLDGEFVMVDRTFYKHNPQKKGDLILCRRPGDKSKPDIKRIDGLPGDTLKQEGAPIVVPQGTIFVSGDGSIPVRAIRGKARSVFVSFSLNEGIRWERTGIGLP